MARKSWIVSFTSSERLRRESEPEQTGDKDCSRAEWCASGKRERQEDGTVKRIPAKTYQTFCPADRGIIEKSLRDFPATYVRMALAVRVRVTGEVLVRVPFGPSVPLRTDVDELMRLMVDAALSWHERVAAVARLSTPDTQEWRDRSLHRRAGSLLASSVPVLAAHMDALLALEREPMVRPACSPVARTAPAAVISRDTILADAGGSDAGLEILHLDYRARAALGETRPAPVRLYGVPCKNCDRRALQLAPPPQHAGDPEYRSICAWCRDAMTEDEFSAWTHRNVLFYQSRVTPAMAAAC